MAAVTIKLNNAGFRALRTGSAATAFNRREAEALAARCGPGYEVKEAPSKNRSRFIVFPATPAAIHDNAQNNTLIRVLGGSAHADAGHTARLAHQRNGVFVKGYTKKNGTYVEGYFKDRVK